MSVPAAASDRFEAVALREFCEDVLARIGAPAPTAAAVADSLVGADVRGVATHGLVRLASYRRQVGDGEVDPAAQPRVVREHAATAVVDGANAFGAVTAGFAVEQAIARAQRHGIGAVTAHHCMHFGTAAHYALRAAERRLVGLAATNTPAVMAPFGGREPAVGNNPFAVAAPMPAGREPFVLDMAQTVVARGRIKLAEMEGTAIPSGWALGPDGRATTDPTVALAGALLPFGGYKGYGLALAIEVLTGVLAGAGLSPELANTSMTGAPAARAGAAVGSVGNLFLVLDPAAFVGRDVFEEGLARLADLVTAVPPAPGFEEVLLPGQLEQRAAAAAAASGVPLASATLRQLGELAADLDVALPVAIRAAV